MKRNHNDLYSQVELINLIASEAIKFFNEDIPEEDRRPGLRLCFKDRETGEDVLHLLAGECPIDKSEKYFAYSRMKAEYVSDKFSPDSEIPLTSLNGRLSQPNSTFIEVPMGGVRGFYYAVGGSGQKPGHDEAIVASIILIVETIISASADRRERKLVRAHRLNLKKEMRKNESFSRLRRCLIKKLPAILKAKPYLI